MAGILLDPKPHPSEPCVCGHKYHTGTCGIGIAYQTRCLCRDYQQPDPLQQEMLKLAMKEIEETLSHETENWAFEDRVGNWRKYIK